MVDDPGSQGKCGNRTERLCGTVRIGRSLPLGVQKAPYASRSNPAANECPDFFKMGDWYYLVFSNYTDGFCTYYRMSRSPKGPWITPGAGYV